MADEKSTRFRFNFGGITLEVSGERQFVEHLYKRVMKDVEKARRQLRQKRKQEANRKERKRVAAMIDDRQPSVWLHRCSSMMQKIYMISRSDVENTPLGNAVDADEVAHVYVAKDVFTDLFPGLEGGQTLWAEFTDVGREKLVEVTDPERKALES